MTAHNVERIQRVSHRFRLLFLVLIFCIPFFDALYWLFFNHLPHTLIEIPVSQNAEMQLPFVTRLLAFLVSLLPVGIVTFGVYTLARLFALYEKAIIFSAANVRLFRTLGQTLLLWVVARLIYLPLLTLTISFNNPPGQRMIAAGFELADLTALITGAVVVLMSWVMEEGHELEDEQAHTV